MTAIIKERNDSKNHKMAFIFFIETPIGILNTRSIMETTIEKELPFQAEAGVFGSDDFLANIGNENLLFLFTFLFI